MKPPKAPPPVAPSKAAKDDSVVTVDLHEQRLLMAEKDGYKPEQLDEMVTLRRGELYDNSIRSYYHGRDTGYGEGFVAGVRARWPWWVWAVLGALGPHAVFILWRLAVVLYTHVAALYV